MTKTTAIILAGGQGTRMKSPLPKVLHPIAGQPMILRVLSQCLTADFDEARLVLGHGHQLVQTVVEPFASLVQKQLHIQLHQQKQQLGTANAVGSADIGSLEGDIIILNGDHPLIAAEDLRNFIADFRERKLDLAVISVNLESPKEFGRIVRQSGKLRAIVETKEASSETLKIKEVNTGIYVVKADVLKKYLPLIKNENAKNEFYLTDLISLAIEGGKSVEAILCNNSKVAHGVNTQEELAEATALVFRNKVNQLMNAGVIFIDAANAYIEESVTVGAGSVIYPGVFIRGKSALGPFCVVEPQAFISDCVIEDGVQVKAGSYLEQSVIKSQAKVGPYARIRPDTVIGQSAQIGNFVELKKVNFGDHSKAGHLTYLGDAEIGQHVNIGCGTITCNYAADRKKYKTKIGDRVFVGSDTQFVAPVEIGSDSIIASGSTITKNVPEGALAVARSRQENKEGMAGRFTAKSENSDKKSGKKEI